MMGLEGVDATPVEPLPDTQAQPDRRGLVVDRAGVRGLRLPVALIDIDGSRCSTVATFELAVQVPARQRGTHMSRFVEFAHELAPAFDVAKVDRAVERLVERLDADAGELRMQYTWFLSKAAPRSGRRSLLDIQVQLVASRSATGVALEQVVTVPITTLCPCSKAISRYGAHNQRSYVTAVLRPERPIAIETLVAAIERHASSAVYAVLKREDEKFVTEAAYENPKFAEDLVRDVFLDLERLPGSRVISVETDNQESIHNHSAFARIVRASTASGRD